MKIKNFIKQSHSNNSNSNLNYSKEEEQPFKISSSSVKNKNSTFNTPNIMTNKFSSFMKKMESSIEMNKIKGVTKYLSDKSAEFKDVIMANAVSPLNQQEITSKLKSFSNYQLNPAQYLNGKLCRKIT